MSHIGCPPLRIHLRNPYRGLGGLPTFRRQTKLGRHPEMSEDLLDAFHEEMPRPTRGEEVFMSRRG
jgi:hypothetical protein